MFFIFPNTRQCFIQWELGLLSNTVKLCSLRHRHGVLCSECHSVQYCYCSLIQAPGSWGLHWPLEYSFQVVHLWYQSTGSLCLLHRCHNILDSIPVCVQCMQSAYGSRSHRMYPRDRSLLCGLQPLSSVCWHQAGRSGWIHPCCGNVGDSCATPRNIEGGLVRSQMSLGFSLFGEIVAVPCDHNLWHPPYMLNWPGNFLPQRISGCT